MLESCGTLAGVRYCDMGQRWGAQCWADKHGAANSIQAGLTNAIPLINDPQTRTFTCEKVPEGFYLVPTSLPGKWEGFKEHCARLGGQGKYIALEVACGNGGNDREILTKVGSLDHGLAFWVGEENTKPEGKHVFCVRDEDALSELLRELAAKLPDRSNL
jgi:hypothetical protein